jgi:hypothetical protein
MGRPVKHCACGRVRALVRGYNRVHGRGMWQGLTVVPPSVSGGHARCPRACLSPDCTSKVVVRGWCRKHDNCSTANKQALIGDTGLGLGRANLVCVATERSFLTTSTLLQQVKNKHLLLQPHRELY